jgi:hypothetical protein
MVAACALGPVLLALMAGQFANISWPSYSLKAAHHIGHSAPLALEIAVMSQSKLTQLPIG